MWRPASGSIVGTKVGAGSVVEASTGSGDGASTGAAVGVEVGNASTVVITLAGIVASTGGMSAGIGVGITVGVWFPAVVPMFGASGDRQPNTKETDKAATMSVIRASMA